MSIKVNCIYYIHMKQQLCTMFGEITISINQKSSLQVETIVQTIPHHKEVYRMFGYLQRIYKTTTIKHRFLKLFFLSVLSIVF